LADEKQTGKSSAEPALPASWRLTFRSSGAQIELVARRYVRMIAPATTTEQPVAGRHAGTWLELRDDAGKPLYHRNIGRLLGVKAEVFHPDGAITHHVGDPESGQFEVVVPDLPEAVSVCIISSPFQAEAMNEPAQEIVRFPLRHEISGPEKSR
jgi:hypothetical protein